MVALPAWMLIVQSWTTLLQDTSVRFAGHANFPRQLPAPEGKPLLDWDVERLVRSSLLSLGCPLCSQTHRQGGRWRDMVAHAVQGLKTSW